MPECSQAPLRRQPLHAGNKPVWLLRLVGLASLLLIGVTYRLWLPQELFPRVPLFEWARGWGAFPHYLALGSIVGGSLGVLIRPTRPLSYWWCGALWLGYGLAMVLDQHRIQPWAWQLLVVALLFSCQTGTRALRLCRWFTVSIYLYSAWSKLDFTFLKPQGLGWQMVATLLDTLSVENVPPAMLLASGWLLVLGEFAVGVLLLVPRTRRLGVWLAIALHFALLLILGPLGMNHSRAVLLWNAFFAIFTPILFLTEGSAPTDGENVPRGASHLATAVVSFATMWPLLEPLGLCDSWLAWGLYSPRNERAVLLLEPRAAASLAPELRPLLSDVPGSEQKRVRMDQWSLSTLEVPIYPENRFRVGIALALARRHSLGGEASLLLAGPADRFTGRRVQIGLEGENAMLQQADRYWFNALPDPFPN